tara:strand:+ start:269 stop:526 length:258 start_codon:yes stop_codon:yes gene_type:complete
MGMTLFSLLAICQIVVHAGRDVRITRLNRAMLSCGAQQCMLHKRSVRHGANRVTEDGFRLGVASRMKDILTELPTSFANCLILRQ